MEQIDLAVCECRPGVLKLSGELDLAGVPEVRRHLAGFDGDVTIECADLTFIDAAGLGMFVGIQQSCEARGVAFLLTDPPRCVTRLLKLTGLDAVFDIRASGIAS